MDVSASKQLKELSAIYNEAVYGKSPESIEAKRRKDDDLAGSPNKKGPRFKVGPEDKKAGTEAWKRYKAGNPNYGLREGADWTEEDYVVDGVAKKVIKDLRKAAESGKGKYVKKADELQEKKQKDTPDQVKAVIAYDKARKATDDATYDSEHGDKKQAKKEKDYAKWQRDTGARDAQKSGHPWEHEKYGTREKEGKKSVKHAHVKDSYDPLHNEGVLGTKAKGILGKEVKELEKATYTMKDTPVVKADKTANPNYKGQKFGVKEGDDWIQKAVKRPGAFTRKAKAAGMSVQQFAAHVDKNKSKYSTRTERQANLAQTFAKMKKEDVEELFYTLIVD